MSQALSRYRDHFNSLLGEFADDAAFLSPEGRHMIRLPHGQVIDLDNPVVSEFLEHRFLRVNGFMPVRSALRDVFRALRARADCNYGWRPRVHLRLGAARNGEILVDLANEQNEFVRIRTGEWEVAQQSFDDVFRTGRGLVTIPTPAANCQATLDPLRPLINCTGAEAWSGISNGLRQRTAPAKRAPYSSFTDLRIAEKP